jgi:hypothetical protein
MAEKIEASLNWPETGLVGVPESEGGLAHEPPSAQGDHAGMGSLYDPALQQGVETIVEAVRELTASLREARVSGGSGVAGSTADLDSADQSLARMDKAAADVSGTLEQINSLLGHRLNKLEAQLDFTSPALEEDDPALTTDTLFRGGLEGITTDGSTAAATRAGPVTWPPWGPTRKRSIWSRMARSNIAVPLLLVAVIAVAGATYKVYKHETKPTPQPTIAPGSITSEGSVKVLDGADCHAGGTTTTVQLAAAQEQNGNYYVAATGSTANSTNTTYAHGLVHWTVTYADGDQLSDVAPANAGASIPGKSTKSWFEVATQSDGSVPPVSVAITAVTASPGLPACS